MLQTKKLKIIFRHWIIISDKTNGYKIICPSKLKWTKNINFLKYFRGLRPHITAHTVGQNKLSDCGSGLYISMGSLMGIKYFCEMDI